MGTCHYCKCDRNLCSEKELSDRSKPFALDDDTREVDRGDIYPRPMGAERMPGSEGLAGMKQSAGLTSSSEQDLSVGDVVLALNGKSKGIVRFLGRVRFSDGIFVGVELDLPGGMNDGSVRGHRYFACEPHHGIFVRPHAVQKANDGFSKAHANREQLKAREHDRLHRLKKEQLVEQSHAQQGEELGPVHVQGDLAYQLPHLSAPQPELPPQIQSSGHVYAEPNCHPHNASYMYQEHATPQNQQSYYDYSKPNHQPYDASHMYLEHASPQTQQPYQGYSEPNYQPEGAYYTYQDSANPYSQNPYGPSEVPSQVHNEDNKSGIKGTAFLYSDFD
mmetsp:Transcript_122767/g.191659  ORF Transcript_122767/g.191659 Transcript_122767/m.191659 type:complete len:333 (-) Transcript_122767:142-1140(-)